MQHTVLRPDRGRDHRPDADRHLRRVAPRATTTSRRARSCGDPGPAGRRRRIRCLPETVRRPHVLEGETPVKGFPDLNVISNVGRSTPPRSVFHVDTSYVRRPPAYTALRAVQIPAHGGETLFTNQYRAFEALPHDIREQLAGRTIRHVMTGLNLADDAETVAEHPVFRRHPISGRTALYLSTPERCVAISGMADAEAKEMIEYLYLRSITEDNTYRHSWSANDIVMWDNGCVLHRADHSGVVGDRVMHRGMVTDYAEN